MYWRQNGHCRSVNSTIVKGRVRPAQRVAREVGDPGRGRLRRRLRLLRRRQLFEELMDRLQLLQHLFVDLLLGQRRRLGRGRRRLSGRRLGEGEGQRRRAEHDDANADREEPRVLLHLDPVEKKGPGGVPEPGKYISDRTRPASGQHGINACRFIDMDSAESLPAAGRRGPAAHPAAAGCGAPERDRADLDPRDRPVGRVAPPGTAEGRGSRRRAPRRRVHVLPAGAGAAERRERLRPGLAAAALAFRDRGRHD